MTYITFDCLKIIYNILKLIKGGRQMLIAWVLSILLFVIGIGSSVVIMEGLKERDEVDLANLQVNALPFKNKQTTKRAG